MQINKVQGIVNQSFKSLYVGQKLANKVIYKQTTSQFLSDFAVIKNNIIANKLDKKRFVDILLDENDNEFYAVIASKEQGIPHNPANKIVIETTKKGLAKFKRWVNEWNHAYNPKTIEKAEKLEEAIRKANWENTSLDKALKEIYK